MQNEKYTRTTVGTPGQGQEENSFPAGEGAPPRVATPGKNITLAPRHIKRFWTRVIKTDECWLWSGRITEQGYGSTMVKGLRAMAHRVSYLIHYGHLPYDLFVCHHCDVRNCVRPDHLFLGTHSDNMQDAHKKGRRKHIHPPRGEANHFAKLTEAQVLEIRRRRAAGEEIRSIQKDFPVGYGTIYYVSKRLSWKELP